MKIGLIGCGRMGSAILEGAITKGVVEPENIWLSSRTRKSAEALAARCHAHVAENHTQVVAECDLVLLGCKPYQLLDVLAELAPSLPGDVALVSVAAGVTLASMATAVPTGTRLVRAMPNTPCMIGMGATGVAAGSHATETDIARTMELFTAVGTAVQVSDEQINAVTGLSGSGPAYVYAYIQSLTEQATAEGLSEKDAMQLAIQTVRGAAEMLHTTGKTPQALIDQVTSPGGTTLAGLEAMAHSDFQAATKSAVRAATERSREIAQES
ncbi:MAG: pyrroline-5-carboxylate reductase [Akkermansiaceae bacterium]